MKTERGTAVSTTETQEQTTGEGNGAQPEQHNGSSGAKKALKVGALAAAAGTAAFAASKAMSSRGEQTEQASSDDGKAGALGGRVSMDQVVSAIGNARWDVLKDLVLPFAESGAKSAGGFVAKEGPELLSESLIPSFIAGFNEAQGKRSGS